MASRQFVEPLSCLSRGAFLCACIAVAAGCHRDMYDQPRYEPLDKSDFFDDHRASRPLPPGVVAFQAPPTDDAKHSGRENGKLVEQIPIPVDLAVLNRGQERFNIFCSNCHGRTGEGHGMIVLRGFKQPPTYHSIRLRGLPVGHFFEVISLGYGQMPAYANQTSVEDRWAIAAYIRALQLSQFADASDLSTAERAALEGRAAQ
jgi:mono/diheme cytochrome c family protein